MQQNLITLKFVIPSLIIIEGFKWPMKIKNGKW